MGDNPPPSDTDLINLFTRYMTRYGSSTNSAPSNEQIVNLETQVRNLKGQISLLDGQEDTYNEVYKNAKINPTNFGLFSKIGLSTMQDWVLAYFYFSYAIFSVLLLLVFVKIAKNKGTAALFVFGVTLSIGVISTLALISYA